MRPIHAANVVSCFEAIHGPLGQSRRQQQAALRGVAMAIAARETGAVAHTAAVFGRDESTVRRAHRLIFGASGVGGMRRRVADQCAHDLGD